MRSFQVFSEEIDDLDYAIEELKKQMEGFRLQKNTCGIVHCGFEADVEELASKMQESFEFPIVGVTCIGIMNNSGYTECSISMLVLTADDVEFAAGITDSIDSYDDRGRVRDTYRSLAGELCCKPKLVLLYMPWLNVIGDDIVDEIDDESGGVLVYGGIASDDWTLTDNYVFCKGEAAKNKVVMIAIAGNIEPKYAIDYPVYSFSQNSKKITKAEGAEIYELDNEPFEEYLIETGLKNSKTRSLSDYLTTPFQVKKHLEDGDEYETLKCLDHIDNEKKCGCFCGRVDDCDEICVLMCSKSSVEESVMKTCEAMFDMIAKDKDYQYSTILISSCSARYCMIAGSKDLETNAYKDKKPEDINIQGAYLNGEFCPIKGTNFGKYHNATHNETFSMLIF